MRTGIFGGAFDPVHKGHVNAALDVIKEFDLDRIIFIPLKIPVHKSQCSAGAADRIMMLEIALRNYPFFSISLDEINRETPSYTVETLERFSINNPADELYFITGSDSFNTFGSWKNPDKIASLASIIVLRRPGFQTDMNLLRKYGNAIEASNSMTDISSSELRSGVCLNLLDAKVADYIEKKRLYGIGN